MSEITPNRANADFPAFSGWTAENQWDVATKASPNKDYWDSWKDTQILNEILEHQYQLATELSPAGDYYVKLSTNDGSTVWGIKDSDGSIVAYINSDGYLYVTGGLAGTPQIFGPEAMGTPYSGPAELDELNGASVMNFADAATKSIILNAQVQDAQTDVVLVWCSPATSGNAKWQLEYRTTADDAAMNGAWTTTDTTDAVSGTAHGQVTTTISLTGLTVGQTLMMKISRLGGDAADTLADVAYMALVRLVPKAT